MSAAPQAAPVLFAGERTVSGTVARTSLGSGRDWASEIVGSLAPGERAVAAIPFEPGGTAVAHAVRGEHPPSTEPRSEPVARHEITERPTPEEYAANVRFAIGRIDAGALQKVVLGRGLDVVSTPPLSPASVLRGLLRNRPGRYVFGMPLAGSPAAPQLIGASPELLVRRRGAQLLSLPLAGSIPRVADPAEDRQRAEELQYSAKDLAEHAFVVDEIVAVLSRVCRGVEADPRPRLVSTDTLHHLGTRIRAELADPGGSGLSALHLAQLLQPTPAVGGVPRTAALDVIAQLESERGPLTGAVGWVDGDGDGECRRCFGVELPGSGKKAAETLETLQHNITSGLWPVNSRIPKEPELMELLGVGKSTVREAVRSLASMGMLEPIKGVGTFVRSRTPVNSVVSRFVAAYPIEEILGYRRALEVEAAQLAAVNRTDEQLAQMRRSHALDLNRSTGAGEGTEFGASPATFHQLIFEAAGNSLMTGLYASLLVPMRSARAAGVFGAGSNADLRHRDHAAILQAIEEQDPARAAQAMGLHADRDLVPRTAADDAGAEAIQPQRATGQCP